MEKEKSLLTGDVAVGVEFDQDFDDLDEGEGAGGSGPVNPEFDSKVKKYIKQLTAKDPAERREAAYWLGESGEPKAISALARTYRKDKDKTVRDAAKYALGMFRALQLALDGSEKQQTYAITLLDKIVNHGQMGRRSPLSPRTLLRIQIGLASLLLVIIALNVLLPALSAGGIQTDQPAATATPTTAPDPIAALGEVRSALAQIRTDASLLQRQFVGFQTSGRFDCAATFSSLLPLGPETAAGFAQIEQLIGQLNSQRSALIVARSVFEDACAEGAEPPAPEIVTGQLDAVTGVLRALNGFDQQIDSVQAVLIITPTEPPSTAAPTETPTPTETNTPTPTISPALISSHIIALELIIQEMTQARGANTLLRQYWQDAQNFGVTDGCRPPYPNIPPDYLPLDPLVAEAYPNLNEAVVQVNIGLSLTRQGWEMFKTACGGRNIAGESVTGLQFVDAANSAYSVGINLLDRVRRGQ